MIASLMVGAAAGTGVLAAVWAVVPPRFDLARAVNKFDAELGRSRMVDLAPTQGSRKRVGRWLATKVAAIGWISPSLKANLNVLDRTIEAHMVSKLTTAAVGLVLPFTVLAALESVGGDVGILIPTVVALALAATFSLVPDVSVARAAQRRRDEMRRALSCYLDLVSMGLAGGRGVPEALPSAARIGQGWAFELIADTLAYARYGGGTPWDALRELGNRVQVPELRDLGSALALVADDGAKIRESLKARAATARSRQLAEAEGSAERASESIKNAHLLLGFMFLLFLGFPAVAAVMAV